jgi:hypothetical protein
MYILGVNQIGSYSQGRADKAGKAAFRNSPLHGRNPIFSCVRPKYNINDEQTLPRKSTILNPVIEM